MKEIMHNRPNLALTFVQRGRSYVTPLLAKLTHRLTCTFLGRPLVWHYALHCVALHNTFAKYFMLASSYTLCIDEDNGLMPLTHSINTLTISETKTIA